MGHTQAFLAADVSWGQSNQRQHELVAQRPSASTRSAGFHPAVSRICNPPAVPGTRVSVPSRDLPNTIRRCSRLKICATQNSGSRPGFSSATAVQNHAPTKSKALLPTIALLCLAARVFAAETPPPTPLLTKSQDALIAVLKSSADRKEKADACRELAVIGTSKAVPVLASLLANEELHHMARYALETIPGPEVNKALRDELTRLKGRSLVGIIGSLGVRKDATAVKPLSQLLSDNDSQVTQAAA